MKPLVLRADARNLPLPDGCVDLIVTSPPYFGLRSYTDGGEHYDGQIGSEATPAEWLAGLVACTAEWMRVLKPEGSLFVNLGDKYSTGNSGQSGLAKLGERWAGGGHSDGKAKQRQLPVPGMPPKSLLGLPWRYALACTDQLGLILRTEIIWAKPNGLPESVTDRVRRAHEQIFHFTRQPRYYSAVDEIREDYSPHTASFQRMKARFTDERTDAALAAHTGQMLGRATDSQSGLYRNGGAATNPLGKLPGSVWDIPSQPLTVPASLGVDHFAAFPMELPRRIITGWSPPGVCTRCSQGRRPVVDKRLENVWHDKPPQASQYTGNELAHRNGRKRDSDPMMRTFGSTAATITGYACACGSFPASQVNPVLPSSGTVGLDAEPDVEPLGPLGAAAIHVVHGDNQRRTASACPPPTRPAIVLDPFMGTGTTLLVAAALGRHGIGTDLSADYCRLASWRCTDPGERAKAMQVPKPPPVADGQEALFAL